jgi:hypothetical protein
VPPTAALPPGAPAKGFDDRFGAAFPGRQSAAPGAPVVAEDVPTPMADPRGSAARALMMQTAQAVPQPNPMTPPPGGATANAGIAPAPPTAPIARAPRQAQLNEPAQADVGYVMPQPAPPPMPPTMTPIMAQIQEQIRQTPPAYRDTVTERLTPYYAQEKAKVTQAHELWKEQMVQHRALELKREEQLGSRAKSVLDAREQAQKIEKANIPEVKQDIPGGHSFNLKTWEWEEPRIAGTGPDTKPAFKGSEFQGKALVNYGRARIAHEGLRMPTKDGATGEELLAGSPLQSALSAAPLGIGRPLRSDVYKEAETHAENFVQAFIRQQSGGAYGKEELEQEARGMLPRYSDTKQQLETKREQREQFLSGMYSIIGPAGQKGAEIDAAKREAGRTHAPASTSAADPLEGREAVWPDKSIRVRRGGQWVPK